MSWTTAFTQHSAYLEPRCLYNKVGFRWGFFRVFRRESFGLFLRHFFLCFKNATMPQISINFLGCFWWFFRWNYTVATGNLKIDWYLGNLSESQKCFILLSKKERSAIIVGGRMLCKVLLHKLEPSEPGHASFAVARCASQFQKNVIARLPGASSR
jgi:hypothetical protein